MPVEQVINDDADESAEPECAEELHALRISPTNEK
jgi:hypothetical protein